MSSEFFLFNPAVYGLNPGGQLGYGVVGSVVVSLGVGSKLAVWQPWFSRSGAQPVMLGRVLHAWTS